MSLKHEMIVMQEKFVDVDFLRNLTRKVCSSRRTFGMRKRTKSWPTGTVDDSNILYKVYPILASLEIKIQ